MSESEHTPGPWHVDGPKWMSIEGIVHRVMNDDRFPAAFVPAWDRPEEGQEDGSLEATANAKLIAAAPDMYEALKEAVLQQGHGLVNLRQCMDAIAKSEGRE